MYIHINRRRFVRVMEPCNGNNENMKNVSTMDSDRGCLISPFTSIDKYHVDRKMYFVSCRDNTKDVAHDVAYMQPWSCCMNNNGLRAIAHAFSCQGQGTAWPGYRYVTSIVQYNTCCGEAVTKTAKRAFSHFLVVVVVVACCLLPVHRKHQRPAPPVIIANKTLLGCLVARAKDIFVFWLIDRMLNVLRDGCRMGVAEDGGNENIRNI